MKNRTVYDFSIAAPLGEWLTDHLEDQLGPEDAARFEKITVPAGLYLVCETERTKFPTTMFDELRREAVCGWLPSSSYALSVAPEISVYHWPSKYEEPAPNRYIELWLPIEKSRE